MRPFALIRTMITSMLHASLAPQLSLYITVQCVFSVCHHINALGYALLLHTRYMGLIEQLGSACFVGRSIITFMHLCNTWMIYGIHANISKIVLKIRGACSSLIGLIASYFFHSHLLLCESYLHTSFCALGKQKIKCSHLQVFKLSPYASTGLS